MCWFVVVGDVGVVVVGGKEVGVVDGYCVSGAVAVASKGGVCVVVAGKGVVVGVCGVVVSVGGERGSSCSLSYTNHQLNIQTSRSQSSASSTLSKKRFTPEPLKALP